MRRVVHSFLALVTAIALNGPAVAQDIGIAVSPILVIDSDRVFRSSRAGQIISTELELRADALVAENKKLKAALDAEELELTNKRATMDPAEFRVLADEFDQKVQRIRAAQDAKEKEFEELRDEENRSFLDVIAPILSGIGRERGAVVILERRAVLLSADSIDITDEAIQRINAAQPDQTISDDPTSPEQPTVQDDD